MISQHRARVEIVARVLFWSALALALAATFVQLFAPDIPALHVSQETAGVYNAIAGLGWLGALLLSLVLLLIRLYRYKHDQIPVPALLWRDLISKGGLASPLVAIFGARILNAYNQVPSSSPLSTYLPWLVMTSLPALIGMWTFLFYEVFVIDRWQDA